MSLPPSPNTEPSMLAIPKGEFWVFGYGSLMWDPGFPHDAVEPAVLQGWHRSFCVYSTGHRGTPEGPGLVVGLSPEGECRGLAFQVNEHHKPATLAYLWQREMALADGYLPHSVRVQLSDGRVVEALTFIADHGHKAYAGELPVEAAAALIATARGARGTNREYLHRTLQHLEELGIHDAVLAALGRTVALVARGADVARPTFEARLA
jgi:cation transport protein ChaC